jgi:hypothetical protein
VDTGRPRLGAILSWWWTEREVKNGNWDYRERTTIDAMKLLHVEIVRPASRICFVYQGGQATGHPGHQAPRAVTAGIANFLWGKW